MPESIYRHLGVREWICAGGYLTRFGGNRPSADVCAAMLAALDGFVDMLDLQACASRAIAGHTGADAGIVTTGASAAMSLGAAAMLAGLDPVRMGSLPAAGARSEILVPRTHRSSYDHALRAAGATLVDVGPNDVALNAGYRAVEAWEIEGAVTERTVGLFATGQPESLEEIERLASVASRHGLPLLVDAAPWLPPRANLRRFLAAGATLVCFSGGKALGGPPGTGFLAGRRDLVLSALMQQMDLTIVPRALPEAFGEPGQITAWPRHGIGRGMKVSREQIVGLLVALDRFAGPQSDDDLSFMHHHLAQMQSRIAQACPGFDVKLRSIEETRRRPLLEISLPSADAARKVCLELAQRTVPIQLSEHRIADGVLTVDPGNLLPDDYVCVTDALISALGARAEKLPPALANLKPENMAKDGL
ncbi:MAG: DegT/DnrJ/EryC1/StrS family aminotransferase [Lautropia sp.]